MADHRDAAAHPERAAFARRVRELRLSKGFSQEALADRASIHRTYLSSLERGARNVGLDNIAKLARALDVSISDLFHGQP